MQQREVSVFWTFFVLLALQFLFGGAHAILRIPAPLPDLYEASITELQDGLNQGHFTSVDLVKAYFSRIEEVNLQGPTLRAVIELNPSALKQAAELDIERQTLGPRGPLHGIPILLKDNIATHVSDGMNTTAGSFALLGSVPPRDATVVAKLRAAGAISLGKANLCEWAHSRGNLPSGFSGRGGQSTSPYFPLADPLGSSSGSGIASAIGLATATLGTETDGSIILPSSRQNLVGIKPTVGLTSRAGVIPISENQDTVGPMTRSVADAAIILTIIAGRDPLDNHTLASPARVPDFTKALKKDALKGVRLGVPRRFLSGDPNIDKAFDASLVTLKELGAIIVDPAEFPDADELLASRNETVVLKADLKFDVQKYIAGLLEVPTGVKTLTDLIAFNIAHASEELVPPYWTSQSQFIAAENSTRDAAYFAALAADHDLGRARGIDATLAIFNLDAIILPADGFTSTPAAIAGYPIITVPLGFQPDNVKATSPRPTISNAPGLPFGLSFLGTAFSEFKLVGYAFAYEQATHTRLKRSAFPAAIPKTQLTDVMKEVRFVGPHSEGLLVLPMA
ncbi:amidase signature enzyme [Multifurca ochricompacta]|uniref:Amidase signature enzyme n=1 Tax=Multifurca ochricompacta TaxID=376703 RepID=A0AAD4LZY3_9AGAM|nr:amidase signature enzyme [Multifurca ochricompacta]KAI0296954.1 amidase signature enzyme [Multifurca ochricompacta]